MPKKPAKTKKVKAPLCLMDTIAKHLEGRSFYYKKNVREIFYYHFMLGQKVEILHFDGFGVRFHTEILSCVIKDIGHAVEIKKGTFEKARKELADTFIQKREYLIKWNFHFEFPGYAYDFEIPAKSLSEAKGIFLAHLESMHKQAESINEGTHYETGK